MKLNKSRKAICKMDKEKTDYPSAKEWFPKAFSCPRCGRLTHGIISLGMPKRICNKCAVPVEYSSDGEFIRDATGAISFR